MSCINLKMPAHLEATPHSRSFPLSSSPSLRPRSLSSACPSLRLSVQVPDRAAAGHQAGDGSHGVRSRHGPHLHVHGPGGHSVQPLWRAAGERGHTHTHVISLSFYLTLPHSYRPALLLSHTHPRFHNAPKPESSVVGQGRGASTRAVVLIQPG